jgi:hypothetical protein
VDLAIRFAIAEGGAASVLGGVATVAVLVHALAAVERGPLPTSAWQRLDPVWNRMAGASA